MVKAKASGKVVVKLGKMTEPLLTITMSKSCKLVDLLEKKDIEYNSSVRVNGSVVAKGYMLKNTDIITIVTSVDGGK